VGSNAGQVSNIYGYAANRNTNVTNVNGGTVRNSYIIKEDGTLQNGNDAKKLDSYAFDKKDTTWKLYDKRTNPLLKVFLTKVTVDGDLQKGWVYDATNHLDIPGWINSGKLTTNDADNDAFAAYKNNNSLLQGEDLKNVGTYSSWLWSGQIASGGDVGPNNLGYDFTVGDITVTKKVLNVTGNTVNRTYGDLLKNHDYALSINGFDGFNDTMKAELDGKVTIIDSQDTIQNSNDTGIITVGDEKRTKNKGTYEWQAGVKLDGSLTGNYEFINNGESSTTTTVHGKSNVLARKVYLNNINAKLTYGSKDAINNHINGVVSIKDLANAIVYGDDVKLADGAVVNVKDGSSYATNKDGRNTADAGTYDNSLKIDHAALTGDANKLGNYELVNNATGSITVDQATMQVKLNDVERTYGNTALINGTAYGVNGLTGNVNGDNYGAGDVTMGTVTGDGAVDGVSGSKVTNDAGDTYKWNANVVAANDKLKQNYKLVVDDGASVVKQATLQVSLNDVVRTYGNATITSGGYSASNITGLVNGDNYDASAITVNKTSDGAIAGVSGSKVTNDAGGYTWSGDLTTDNAALKNNYKLELKEDGKSVVGKAKLNVGLSDVYRTYGNAKITSGSYSAGNITGLVNGDNYDASEFKVKVNSDGAIAGVTGDRVTNDHGDYTWSGTVEVANAGLNKNYDLVVNGKANSYVGKAQLSVSLNDVVRTYGNATITSGGYGVSGITGLVNGDGYNAGDVKVTVTGDGAIAGVSGSRVTNNAGNYEWTGSASTTNAGLDKNYNLVVTANGKSKVEKATLNVGLSDVVRTYGNAAITSGSYSASNITGLVNGDSYDASAITVNKTSDGAIAGVSGSKVTNDAGDYTWSGTAKTDNAGLGKNYNLVVTANGKSKVEKATLNVGLSDVYRTYGNAKITNGSYSAGNITGLVNGDNYDASDFKVKVNSDGAIAGVSGSKVTNDAGNYTWSGTVEVANAGLNKNYDLVVNGNGNSYVGKAQLSVSLNDVVRTYGNATITSGGYGVSGITGLVNGDSYNAGDVKVTVNSDGALTGNTEGKVTNNAGEYTWSGTATTDNAGLGKNYNLVVTANGKSKVEKATLNVGLSDVYRTYGNAKITNGSYSAGNITGLVNGDNYDASDFKVKVNSDDAIAGVSGSKVTNDAGHYTWSGTVEVANAGLNKNYDLVVNGNANSYVGKAQLSVSLNDVVRTYGNAKITNGSYSASNITGLVNGDSYDASAITVNKTSDGAIAGVSGSKVTNAAGNYEWTGSASTTNAGLGKNYNLVVTANGKSKVEKATLNVGLSDVVRTYGNATITSGGYSASNITGLVNGDSYDASAITVNKTSDGAIAGVSGSKVTNAAGDYTWSGTATTDNAGLGKNYNLVVTANGKSKVEKATLNVGLNDVVRTYGNATITSGGYSAGNITGLVNGDSYDASAITVNKTSDGAIAGVSGSKVTNAAGNYEWTGSASTTNAGLGKNYNLVVTANGKSKVEKANLVVNLNDITRVYGNLDAKDYRNAFTFGNNAGLVNGDNGLVINADKDGAIAGGTLTNVEKTNNVGSYEWNGTASGVDNLNTNYDVTVNAGKSDVTKANLVVNLNDITRVYGNLDAKNYSNAFTFGANAGLVNGDNGLVINANTDGAIAEGSVSDVKKTNNVGNYEWNGTASGVDNLNTNYDVTVNAGKSDVTKANLVVNLNDITRVYGNLDAKNYSNAFTFGANAGLVNGDNGLVINADKDVAIAGGTLTNVEKTNNVGNYEWNGTASGVDNLNTNYNVQINAGKSDVTKANLVVNLNDITRVYGNLDAKDYSNAFTFGNNAGLVNGDNGLVINADKDGAIAGGTLTNVEKTNNVGSYEWNGTASGVDNLNTNYNVQINAGKSDVTKANLVVNLNDITRIYGNLEAKDYSKAYTFGENAGLVNGDNGLVINANKDGAIAGGTLTNVEKTNNVGNYEWNGTASGVENLNTNYDVTVNAGKSDVTKANLVVNLNDITRIYGNLDAKDYSKAFTFGNNAGLVNGDNGLVINADKDGAIAGGTLTNVEKTNNVGNYEWNGTASGVDNLNTNYDVTVNAGKSDVTKANLVVNLNDITRIYGNLDAKDYSNAFTFGNNAGLVNGDNGLVINANADGAIAGGTLTNVEKTNNVGSYEWNGTASGVDNLNTNYNVTVNAGKSDVTKANLVVNLNDITRVYGNLEAKDYSKAYTFGENAGLVNGDNGLVINANKDGAIAGGTLTNVEKTNNVGNYEWNGTASGVDNLNTNYNVQINAGKSDVTKAKLTFVVDDKTITQGVPAKYTGKANGLTNGDTLAGIGVGGYELDSSVNPLIIGVYEDKIGVLINGSLHLTGGDGLLKNYKVEIDPGTLTVLPSFNPADDYWFGTATWDKERNLRERKAEFHYVAGGMSL